MVIVVILFSRGIICSSTKSLTLERYSSISGCRSKFIMPRKWIVKKLFHI